MRSSAMVRLRLLIWTEAGQKRRCAIRQRCCALRMAWVVAARDRLRGRLAPAPPRTCEAGPVVPVAPQPSWQAKALLPSGSGRTRPAQTVSPQPLQ